MKDCKKIFLPYIVLNAARDNNELKELSWFLYLKRLYSNSCIFNYNIHSLSKKSGKSYSFIKRNVKIFLKNGWCELHHGNLIFKKLPGKKKCQLNFESLTYKNIYHALTYNILLQKKKQCDYVISLKQDLRKPARLENYKRADKFRRKHKLIGEIVKDFNISVFSIAKLFGCSISNASKIVSELVKKNLITVFRNYDVIITGISLKAYKIIKDTLPKSSYWYKYQVYQTLPNTISFNSLAGLSLFTKK